MLTDAEIVRALAEGLDALGVWRYRFLVNSRHALRGLLRFHGSTGERSGGFLWTLDRLNKVGAEAVTKELVDVHGLEEMSARLLVNDLTAQVTEPVRSRIAMGEQGRLGLD